MGGRSSSQSECIEDGVFVCDGDRAREAEGYRIDPSALTVAFLYAIAMAVLTAYGTNLLWLCRRHAALDRLLPGPGLSGPPTPPDSSGPPIPPNPPDPWPRVTVQLPIFNEAPVVERLIDACAWLDYPHDRFDIQILDDSTDETTGLAVRRADYWQRRGVRIVHVHRSKRDGFKAGALQNGLRLATGEYIAVFDADFLPRPDFLRRLVPAFTDERLGLVQARWGHLNRDDSLLTRIQAFGLDTHFALEQRTRHLAGCFMHFNGSAGIWRRACIVDAGGWQADTLAEDLDLSYRAQLAGWRFRFFEDVEVPAELPGTIGGLRSQQFRWAKGSVEASRKLLRTVWASPESLRRKVQATFHMTGHMVFPFVWLATLLHAPLVVANHRGMGPGESYFGWMALGLIGFAGFGLAPVLAQRRLYADWPRRLSILPAFMAGTIGLCVRNTRAVLEALFGKRTPFVRTPKFGGSGRVLSQPGHDAGGGGVGKSSSTRRRLSVMSGLEIAMLVYSVCGMGCLVAVGEWAAVPFQGMFVAGFGLVCAAMFRG